CRRLVLIVHIQPPRLIIHGSRSKATFFQTGSIARLVLVIGRNDYIPCILDSRITDHHSYSCIELFWWLFTIVLFAVGVIGTIAPVLPGTTIILAAAMIHRLMLGADKSISWRTIVVLVLLTLLSYVFDFLGSYFGAKYFGATKWGAFGAIIGA